MIGRWSAPIQAPAARLRPWLAAGMLAGALILAGGQDGDAQVQIEGEVGARGGDSGGGAPSGSEHTSQRQIEDWLVQCGKPAAEAPERCEMVQERTNDAGNPVLVAALGRIPGRPDLLGMLIMVPLGIALPPGVSLEVDGGPELPLQVERCEPAGCRIELVIKDDLLAALKAGRTATVSFQGYDQQGRRQPVSVDLSLLGFTAALAEVGG